MENNFIISIDTDWVSDTILEDTLQLLDDYQVEATLFMTNKTNVDIKGHEIALHPNYTSVDFEKHFCERLNEFPEAKGVRSHSLFFTERLRAIYHKYNIEYQSNQMMYREPGIKPFMISPTVVEIPIFFMDTFNYIMNGKANAFEDADILNSSGLKVFDFHPIHLYLNTSSLEHYDEYKQYYHDDKRLLDFKNSTKPGIRDWFTSLLQFIKNEKKQTGKMIGISDNYRKNYNEGINNR